MVYRRKCVHSAVHLRRRHQQTLPIQLGQTAQAQPPKWKTNVDSSLERLPAGASELHCVQTPMLTKEAAAPPSSTQRKLRAASHRAPERPGKRQEGTER